MRIDHDIDRIIFHPAKHRDAAKQEDKKDQISFTYAAKDKISYYSQQGNERAREKHDVRISLLILHRVVSFLQL